MDDDDPFDLLTRWLTEQRATISRQVTIRKSAGAYGTRTQVAIDHRLSCDLAAHDGWRISRSRRSFRNTISAHWRAST